MEEEIKFKNKSNELLSGYLHKPKQPTKKGIVLAHCFTCSKHQRLMRKICDHLAENNFLVLRFDFSGNGESQGKFENATYSKEIKDLDSAINFISKKVKTIGVLGHSMGAAVSILQTCKDKRIKSLCILAGQSDTSKIKDLFQESKLKEIDKKGKAEVLLFGKKFIINKKFLEDAESHDVIASLSKFKKPFFVIHGSDDSIIDVQNAHIVYKAANSPKKKKILNGADHLFSKEEDLKQVKRLILNWFKKTL